MRDAIARSLDSRHAPVYAAAASLAIGLLFALVRAPHPWGWQGIDQYHELAQAMARGEPFGTTDVPWGYAYFVAAFYKLFGPHAWIPVLAQVIANAAVPVLLYRLVVPMAGVRASAAAAWLAGVFSFNTIYASTLASDAICTVLFLASLLAFARGHRSGRRRDFIVSGLLFGIVPQFRPNLILLPALIALAYVGGSRTRRKASQMIVFLACVGVALSPWVLRNYSLTGRVLPTSTHGGIQLWYGTLQVGPYLESRAYNPRSVFEPASFDYTSLADDSLVVEARRGLCSNTDTTVAIVYWTDRDGTRRRVPMTTNVREMLTAELPGQPAPTTMYYYVEAVGPPRDGVGRPLRTPLDGDVNPFVYFISSEHLADLDRHDDLLDIFDLVRLMRAVAWRDDGPALPRLDLNRDGASDVNDVRAAVITLLGDGAKPDLVAAPDVLRWEADTVVLTLADGSRLTARRTDSGRVTDLDVLGPLGKALIISRRPWTPHPSTLPAGVQACELVGNVSVNEIFYRREVHEMGRYLALAFDNISREPGAFLAASLYRIGRLFVLRGSDDAQTAHQFAGSRAIYAAGLALSIGYLLLFFAGAALAVRRRSQLCALLVPIAYVPLTICFVLTNMRYTITVQPLMFEFVALALVTLSGLATPREAGPRPDLSR